MVQTGDPDVDEILAVYAHHPHDVDDPTESLRERKKRRARQQISDVATAMFLAHGFDNVTVARIAAACEVSEQTVFNYFPTKESMFFDRTESMISAVADAVREAGSASLVDVAVRALYEGIHFGPAEGVDEAVQLRLFRLFCDTAIGSPRLVAAQLADQQRFVDEVSVALGERVGARPNDPEVQLATLVIAGLFRVGLQSTFRRAHEVTSVAAMNDVVRDAIARAARLAEPTLTAFDNLRAAASART